MYSRILETAGKKNLAFLLLIFFAAIGMAAVQYTDEKFVNLKVLPKNISSEKLEKIMSEDFQEGLGVTCNYCHVEDKTAHKFDYVSDAKPEKETAREMMRMTLELNKTNFKQEHPALGDTTLIITCYTCHHGYATPKEKK